MPIPVRAGPHDTGHDRMVVLQPGVAHHCIFLIVKGIENLHSVHTVSRHRQEILGKLQVKNSIAACRVAKDLKLI